MPDISLIQVEKEAMRPLIRMVYAGDEAMREQYHILKGATLEEMVEYTYKQTTEGEEAPDVEAKYYQVTKDGRPVGYTSLLFGGEIGVLHTFGIDKAQRDEETKDGWLKAVREEFGDLFFVLTLRLINERAVGFFKKKGFDSRIEELDGNKFYILWPQV